MGESSGGRQRAWTDLGENEGWRDPAQGRVRAFGQVRGAAGGPGRVREGRGTFRRVGGSIRGFWGMRGRFWGAQRRV